MLVRQPAVAGMFYPEDPQVLQQQVDNFISQPGGSAATPTIMPKALIVPHAGYIYSGPIAGSAYQLIPPIADRISNVVLLGPSHRVPLRGIAAPTSTFFHSPLGDIPIDHKSINKLSALSLIELDDKPHQFEHSLEVQLPFLQTVINSFMLLPLVVGEANSQQVAKVLRCVWGGDETLVVVSSDLSHYHSYMEAQLFDHQTTTMIEHFDAHITSSQACGCRAINGLLKLASDEHLSIKTLDLRNSGDAVCAVTGDKDRVVGYGAYAIY